MPYQIFTPQDLINLGWEEKSDEINHYTYVAFNKDKAKLFFLDCGINVPDFISDCKNILADKTAKHRIFCEKTIKAVTERIGSLDNKWLINLSSQKGILHISSKSNIALIYKLEKQEASIKFRIYSSTEQLMGLIALMSEGLLLPDGEIILNKVCAKTFEKQNDINEQAKNMALLCFHLLFFLEFAEIETKIVNNKTKRVVVDGEKIVNQTDFELEIINSNYYTTIMRTEGFNVRGHWRWQPYGSGDDKKVKLIYIRDFEKHGYTRKAKILSEPQNTENNLTI